MTADELRELIIGYAFGNPHIRGVLLNGSRGSGKDGHVDRYSDFDIIYLADDVNTFADPGWLEVFGERVIMQIPEPYTGSGSAAFLVQLSDGNRIDLTICPSEKGAELCRASQTVILLDKDHVLSAGKPSSADYYVRRPSQEEFAACANEFWWVSLYTAKGILRCQLLYSVGTFYGPLSDALYSMLEWLMGTRCSFAASAGSFHKYLPEYLTDEENELLSQALGFGGKKNKWKALMACCRLFAGSAELVSASLGLEYDRNEEMQVLAYMKQLKDTRAVERIDK